MSKKKFLDYKKRIVAGVLATVLTLSSTNFAYAIDEPTDVNTSNNQSDVIPNDTNEENGNTGNQNGGENQNNGENQNGGENQNDGENQNGGENQNDNNKMINNKASIDDEKLAKYEISLEPGFNGILTQVYNGEALTISVDDLIVKRNGIVQENTSVEQFKYIASKDEITNEELNGTSYGTGLPTATNVEDAGSYWMYIKPAGGTASQPIKIDLIITARPIIVTADSAEYVFDNTEKTLSGFDSEASTTVTNGDEEVLESGLLATHELTGNTNEVSRTEVGEEEHTITKENVIIKAGDVDVTGNYEIKEVVSGLLKITSEERTITYIDYVSGNEFTELTPKTYETGIGATLPTSADFTLEDGYELKGFTALNEEYNETTNPYVTNISATETGDKTFYAHFGEVDGAWANVTFVASTGVEQFASGVKTTFRVLKSNGFADVIVPEITAKTGYENASWNNAFPTGALTEDNYIFTATATLKEYTVVATEQEKEYTGNAQSYDGTITGAEELSNKTITYTLNGVSVANPTDVGVYQVTITYDHPSGVKTISTNTTLEITKRDVTIIAKSEIKDYTGSSITISGTESVSGLVAGHSIIGDTDGATGTDVGEYTHNVGTNIKIMSGLEDKTGNYNIITESGKLIIRNGEATITYVNATTDSADATTAVLEALRPNKYTTGSNDALDLPTTVLAPTGYKFVGFTAENIAITDSNKVTAISPNSVGDKTFYAHFAIDETQKITINFEAGRGIDSITGETTIEILVAELSWEAIKNAAPTAVLKTAYENPVWNIPTSGNLPTSEVTYTVEATPIEYTITYKYNNGNADTTSTYTIESLATIVTKNDAGVYANYNFRQWVAGTYGDETYPENHADYFVQNSDNGQLTIKQGMYGDIFVSAIWEGYATFDANGGIYADNTAEKVIKPELPAGDFNFTFVEPTREHYDLVGWSTNSADTEGVTLSELEKNHTSKDGNVTFYAIWKLKPDGYYALSAEEMKTTYNSEIHYYNEDLIKKSSELVGVPTITYTLDGEVVINPTNAGTYDVTISYPHPSGVENEVVSVTTKLIIDKAKVTLSVSDVGVPLGQKSYDVLNANIVKSGEIYNNEILYSPVQVTGKNINEFLSNAVSASTYKDAITVSYNENKNYEVTVFDGDISVLEEGTLAISSSSMTKTYDGNASNLSVKVSGAKLDDTVVLTYTTEGVDGLATSTNTITLTVESADNTELTFELPAHTNASSTTYHFKANALGYQEVSGNATINISQRPVTITAKDLFVPYGQVSTYTVPANHYEVSENGFIGLDNADDLSIQVTIDASITDATGAGEKIGKALIAGNQHSSNNYKITYVNADVTITELGWEAFEGISTSKEKVYDGQALEATEAEILAKYPENSTIVFTETPKVTDVKIDSTGNVLDNTYGYIVSNPNYVGTVSGTVVLKITQRPVTITANSSVNNVFNNTEYRVSGVTASALNEVLKTGLLAGHSATTSNTGVARTDIGTVEHIISIEEISIRTAENDVKSNYAITIVQGVLEVIENDDLLADVSDATSENRTKIYDGKEFVVDKSMFKVTGVDNADLLDEAVFTFALSDDIDGNAQNNAYSTDIPTVGKDVGKIYFDVKVSVANYGTKYIENVSLEIIPRNVSIVINDDSKRAGAQDTLGYKGFVFENASYTEGELSNESGVLEGEVIDIQNTDIERIPFDNLLETPEESVGQYIGVLTLHTDTDFIYGNYKAVVTNGDYTISSNVRPETYGSVTIEYVDEDGNKIKSDYSISGVEGDSYDLSSMINPSIDGYTYESTAGEVTGNIYGDIVITSNYTTNIVNPEPEVPVEPLPVDPTPVEPTPVDPTPDVDIEDDNTPLAPAPDVNDDETPDLIIKDDEIPLGNTPQTSDKNFLMLYIATAITLAGLATISLFSRKRKED